MLEGGAAAVYRGLDIAATMLRDRTVHYCIVGGVDSLINEADLSRLSASHRLRGPTNAQGLIPAEGASFLLVSHNAQWRRLRPLGQLLGIGMGFETKSVLGEDYSVGDGLLDALSRAADQAHLDEAALAFVASTFNGERYGAWEAMIARPRFYRTRRERLELIYPAMSVGEMGTAAPAFAVIVACTAIDRGYAPGPQAMCEAASEEGLRGACVVGPSPSPPAFAGPGRRAG